MELRSSHYDTCSRLACQRERWKGALSVYISQVSAETCPQVVLWVSFIKWRNKRGCLRWSTGIGLDKGLSNIMGEKIAFVPQTQCLSIHFCQIEKVIANLLTSPSHCSVWGQKQYATFGWMVELLYNAPRYSVSFSLNEQICLQPVWPGGEVFLNKFKTLCVRSILDI